MATDRLREAMNEQIGHEFFSAYVYLSMSAYCENHNLTGFAHWLREQAREEVDHALRFVDFLLERGQAVRLPAMAAPPAEFGSPLEVMEAALEHERKISGRIGKLYAMAVEEQDYPAQVFLQWFVTEQVEEEATVGLIVERLKLFGAEGVALFGLDQELGSRSGEDVEAS